MLFFVQELMRQFWVKREIVSEFQSGDNKIGNAKRLDGAEKEKNWEKYKQTYIDCVHEFISPFFDVMGWEVHAFMLTIEILLMSDWRLL